MEEYLSVHCPECGSATIERVTEYCWTGYKRVLGVSYTRNPENASLLYEYEEADDEEYCEPRSYYTEYVCGNCGESFLDEDLVHILIFEQTKRTTKE